MIRALNTLASFGLAALICFGFTIGFSALVGIIVICAMILSAVRSFIGV